MSLRTKFAAVMLALVIAPSAAVAGESRYGFLLSTDGMLDRSARPVTATPFDPTSLPQDRFFGRTRYSTRAVAVELILNAASVRRSDSLVYRRHVVRGYRPTTHWRLRASKRRITVRYEIRF